MIKAAYEKFLLPKLLDTCCSTKPIQYQRKKIVPQAKGTVLEIGVGSGLNIPFYKKTDIEKIYGLDPSEELCEMARKNSEESELNINFLVKLPHFLKILSSYLFLFQHHKYHIHKL